MLIEDIDSLRGRKIDSMFDEYMETHKGIAHQGLLQMNNISNHEFNRRRDLMVKSLHPIIEMN